MTAIIVAIFCLAYVLGLLLTGLPDLIALSGLALPKTLASLPVGGLAMLLGGVGWRALYGESGGLLPNPGSGW